MTMKALAILVTACATARQLVSNTVAEAPKRITTTLTRASKMLTGTATSTVIASTIFPGLSSRSADTTATRPSGLSAGAIAGIEFGTVLFILVPGAATVRWRMLQKRRQSRILERS